MKDAKYPGIYLEKGRDIYMMTWSVNGKRFRESSHTRDPQEAFLLRCKRKAETEDGAINPVDHKKVLFRELFDDLEAFYEKKGYDSETLKHRLKPLHKYFDHRRVIATGSTEVEKYGPQRMNQETYRHTPVSTGTVNRELSILRRALTLGKRYGKVKQVPYFDFYEEAGAREGHYEWKECLLLSKHLPEPLKNLPLIYFLSGWRKNEILTLEWHRVDFENLLMWIPAGQTKDRKPRTYPFRRGSKMHRILQEQREYTDRIQLEKGMIIPLVFHREGALIRTFYGAWESAHKAAKLPLRVPHLLRHSTTRVISLAQAPRVFGKQITGHSSDKVFDGYAGGEIESLRATTGLMEDYLEGKEEKKANE